MSNPEEVTATVIEPCDKLEVRHVMGQIEKDLQDHPKEWSCASEGTLLDLLDELEEEHKTEIPQPVDTDGVPWIDRYCREVA